MAIMTGLAGSQDDPDPFDRTIRMNGNGPLHRSNRRSASLGGPHKRHRVLNEYLLYPIKQ